MDKAQIKTTAVLGIVTLCFGLLVSHAGAKERKPSREDLRNLEDIKRNQTCIRENRPNYEGVINNVQNRKNFDPGEVVFYNVFLECKAWNEAEVKALARNGWRVAWDTMTLVEASIEPEPSQPKAKDTNPRVSIHQAKDGYKPVPSTAAAPSGDKIDLSRFGEKDRLSHEQLVSVLRDAGFTGHSLKVAYAVARAESGGRPKAFNGAGADKSYGIFQINMLGKLGPARRKSYGLASNDELFQPEVNAKIAYQMSGGGANWKPWGAYTNESYKRYLDAL